MPVTLRPFGAITADYAACIAGWNAIWPDLHQDTFAWRRQDALRDKQLLFERIVMELDGVVIGYGQFGATTFEANPHRYGFRVYVRPDRRRRGAATAFMAYLLERLERHEPVDRQLIAPTREDQPAGIAFLKAYGFHQVMRFPASRLNPQHFDEERFRPYLDSVHEQGIEIVPLAELMQRDPLWKTHYYELAEHRLMPDVPLPGAYQPHSMETFESHVLNNPGFLPAGTFVALDGGDYVGVSNVMKPAITEEVRRLDVGLTGVVRSHRRRGIAWALKVYVIMFARDWGASRLDTDNEENSPMYTLNLALGFTPLPAWLNFQKDL